jgi:hypothetical protein
VVGAVGVNWLQSLLTTHYPDLWILVLGGMFVAVVLFFPDGVVGTIQKMSGRLRRVRADFKIDQAGEGGYAPLVLPRSQTPPPPRGRNS